MSNKLLSILSLVAMAPAWAQAQVIGDTVTIGTTWYENQHIGTIGRMVEKDEFSYMHFTWTNGLNSGASDRHVYYNGIDPQGIQFWPMTGYPIESSIRAGFATLDIMGSLGPVIAFHWLTETSANTAVAVLSPFGWMVWETPLLNGQGLIWPRMQVSRDGLIRIVSHVDASAIGDPFCLYYTTGYYDSLGYYVTFDPWTEVSATMTIAQEIAVSDVSDRIAFGWTLCRVPGFPEPGGDYNQYDNDIWLLIDDDGQNLHFEDAFNLTNFIPPDSTCMANRDTLRAYTDMSLFFDQEDFLHIAFTTPGYYHFQGLITIDRSLVWHWSEQIPNEFQLVANGWYLNYAPGAWQRNVQRPSLGQDPATGYLYCMYQQYDSSTVSAAGYPSGEVYVSVSTDGGHNWSVGTNVTQTVSPMNALPGQCYSEVCPTIAKLADGECHIMYVLDRDAGNVIQGEGLWTLNEVKYHSVPVDLIPTTPLMPQDIPFHVEEPPGVEPDDGFLPTQFSLHSPFPNPFNPITTLSFTLPVAAEVKLEVFDIRGQRAGVEFISTRYPAGTHRVPFDGSDLSSGLYLAKLTTGDRWQVRKMVLLK